MTTTELIKILQDNETGAISHKPREISLTINGRYMPNPQITLSSTGDGICGAEIDLDINGEWLEQEPCGDAISKQAVDTLVDELARAISDERCCISRGRSTATIMQDILDLPPVTPEPKTGHCRECRWWKDSDGLYRRGGHAESKCPINRKEVFEGNGYCYMFEPKESEDNE